MNEPSLLRQPAVDGLGIPLDFHRCEIVDRLAIQLYEASEALHGRYRPHITPWRFRRAEVQDYQRLDCGGHEQMREVVAERDRYREALENVRRFVSVHDVARRNLAIIDKALWPDA